MSTKPYRLPDLLSLLPKKLYSDVINPHLNEAETSFNAWVEKNFGASLAKKVKKCDVPLFTAAVYPLAPNEQLRVIIDWCASGFLLDDTLDRCGGEDARAVVESWMNLLRDASATKSTGHPLVEMMHSELLCNVREAFDPFHWPRFVNENEKWVAETVAEAHGREARIEKNIVLDIKSLQASRRLSSATFVCFILLQYSHSLYIPDDVLTHPLVQEIETAMVDFLVITNDIYSFKKEFNFDRAFGNILTAIQEDPENAHLDFQGVLDYAETLGKEALDCVAACACNLPSFGSEIDQYLTSYVNGLMDMAVGNVHWSVVTCRYDIFESDEDKKNNIVRLAL